jgi:putative peptidoglycan lipid II flippase
MSSYRGRHFAGTTTKPVPTASAPVEPGTTTPPVASDASSAEASVGRSAALMSVLVIVSRITGFFRTWGQAYALGVTVMASCYTVANNLPNQLYELVMGGMLITAFLPVYMSVRKRAGAEGASRYASNLVSLVVIIMGAVAVLGLVFAAQVIWTQSFNATEEFDFDLATYFFRFFVIEVVLYALSSILSGILNAERDYFWSTAAPIFNNVVCTASFFIYAALADSNPTIAILALAIGNPAGVLIQVVMQIPSLKKHGIHIRPYVDVHDPAIRETLSIGIPSLIVTGASFVTYSVQTSCQLSVTVSGASVGYYARLWYTLPYAILSIPITTAMFTELSSRVAEGDMDGFVAGVSSGTAKIMFYLVPFAMFLMVFAPCLITLLAAGKFTADQIDMTGRYLVVLAVSLPFYGVCTYLQKVCSSLRRMRVFAVASVVAAIVQVLFCFVFTPLFGLDMVALSSLLFFIAVDLVSFVSLKRTLGRVGMRSVVVATLRACAFGVAGAVVGGAILWVLTTFWAPLGDSAMRAFLYCVIAGIPAVIVTSGLAMRAHVPEMSFLDGILDKVRRRLGR